jgi:hypothetical protein
MHRAALAWTQCGTGSGSCWTRTLENRLSWNRASRRRTASRRAIRNWLSWLNRRGLVNRTGPRLRNNHARSRHLGTRRGGRRSCRGRTLWRSRRRCTQGGRSRNIDRWRGCNWTGRRWPRRHARSGRGWRLRRHNRGRGRRNRGYGGRNRSGRSNGCGSHNSGRNWRGGWGRRSCWLGSYRSSCGRFGLLHRRGGRSRRRSRCRRSSGLLFIKNGLQHVSRLGDMRQVNLGLDFVRASMRSTTRLRRAVPVPRAFEVRTNFFRFVLFERTGMRLLLGDTNFGQYIENGFAFDFQFPGQIVDSNLTHPPLCSSELVPLSLHINLA